MLRAGIVGLPNVGKSTLFNALTRTRKAEAANYPFCTIEPNVGIVTVPDERLQPIATIAGTPTLVPAAIEFVDIAGLVKGAASGEGLGNKFLAHIREVDAIVQVVRCFEDTNIVHVEDHLDPIADIETIQTELMLADMESLARQVERLERVAKGGDKTAKSADRSREAPARAPRGREAGAHARDDRRGARGRPAVLPAVDEADALRLQRRRRRARDRRYEPARGARSGIGSPRITAPRR